MYIYDPPLQFAFAKMCARTGHDWLHREILYTTKKFVKSVSAQTTSQPIKINGKSSAYFLSLFLCWCDTSSRRVVRRRTFRQELKKQALHFTCLALCVDCTMHRPCSISYSSRKFWCAFFLMRFITWELAFGFSFRHGDLKGLKMEVVSPEVMHKSGNWTERYDWSSG